MKQFLILTQDEIIKLSLNEEVSYIDRNGVKVIIMSEDRYQKKKRNDYIDEFDD